LGVVAVGSFSAAPSANDAVEPTGFDDLMARPNLPRAEPAH
jgi:hypothetical protein